MTRTNRNESRADGVDADGDHPRVLVVNPKSGSEDHVDTVGALGESHGFDVRLTSEAGDAKRIAREAATNGTSLVAAAGGDGTVNEVANGIAAADALDSVTFAVVPAGTGNNFASNVGIQGIEHAFDLIESGDRRTIDVGEANGRLFLNSCVGGITAEASESTSSERKRKLGVLAYVIETLQTVPSFDPLPLTVAVDPETVADESVRKWRGEAAFVLIGNARQFPNTDPSRTSLEDGLLDVTVVERAPVLDLVRETAVERLFGEDGDHLLRLRASELSIETRSQDPVSYSLDGEFLDTRTLDVRARKHSLTLPVGESYESATDDGR